MSKIRIIKNDAVILPKQKKYYEQFVGKEFDSTECFQYSEHEWCLPIPSYQNEETHSFWRTDELEFID